jgi:hypothetical protein
MAPKKQGPFPLQSLTQDRPHPAILSIMPDEYPVGSQTGERHRVKKRIKAAPSASTGECAIASITTQ